MGIRLPLKVVASFNDDSEVGAGSVAGGVNHPFQLLQDSEGVVVKFTASVAGTGVSAVLQTTDDGGTTYYDVARTSIVSNANNVTAEWFTVPVFGYGQRTGVVGTSVVATGSVVSFGSIAGTTGSAAASTLGQASYSGMPILSQQARVIIRINGNITSAASNSIRTTVYQNQQAAK